MGKDAAPLEDADIVTNSGHLRPLDEEAVGRMKPGAAIPLMYEAWELRPDDVDSSHAGAAAYASPGRTNAIRRSESSPTSDPWP